MKPQSHTLRRRDLLRAAIGATALGWGAGARGQAPGRGKQPNILFFFIDDMGWQDTSVPFHTEVTALNRRYRTPNMERLAREGMKLTQAYACAVCSPSRISLMTGMNAARHQVTNWTLHKDRSPDRNHPKVRAPEWNLNGMAMAAGTPRTLVANTLPAILRESGYRTIHCGKAHFGANGTPGSDPKNLGFDINIAGHAAGGPGSYHGDKNFSAEWRGGGNVWDVPGLDEYHGQQINLTAALTREAIKAVEGAVADEKPFYLCMSHYTVHAPWEKDRRFFDKYADAGLKGVAAVLASMLEGMDQSLGDLIDTLERLGVADDTIVVFMSDNGQPSQVPRNLPLRGHKLTPYEGGVRVPCIARWPGVTRPGSVESSRYVIIEDIFPTFLEMAGVTEYKQPGGTIDGVSFAPLLRGAPDASPTERTLFWHYPHTYDQPPYSIARRGDWKLIYQHVPQRLELYNLRDDIGESTNRASEQPEITRTLAQLLSDHLRECGSGMTIVKATGKPVPYPDEIPEAEWGGIGTRPVDKGASAGAFAVVRDARIDPAKDGAGHILQTDHEFGGLALAKYDALERSPLTIQSTIQTRAAAPNWQNGFIAFGAGDRYQDLVKCGVFLGGKSLTILEGADADDARVDSKLTGDMAREFAITIRHDPRANTVTVECAGQTLTHKLRKPIPRVTHIGYCARRTTTEFGAIEIPASER